MNILIVFITCLSLNLHQDLEIPYLGEQYFSYELDYSFKKRQDISTSEKNNLITKRLNKGVESPLPYVKVIVILKDLESDIFRYKVSNNFNRSLSTKRIKELPTEVDIDMGFGEDIKDRTGPHQFILTLIDDNKNIDSRVVFEFDEEGNMMVNGVLSGKI